MCVKLATQRYDLYQLILKFLQNIKSATRNSQREAGQIQTNVEQQARISQDTFIAVFRRFGKMFNVIYISKPRQHPPRKKETHNISSACHPIMIF